MIDFIIEIPFAILGIMALLDNKSCNHPMLVDFMYFSVLFKFFTVLILFVPLICIYLDEMPPFKMFNSDSKIPFESNQCSICLSSFDLEKNQLVILECKHVFDKHCILVWTKTSKTCPNCRADLKANSYLYEFLNSY